MGGECECKGKMMQPDTRTLVVVHSHTLSCAMELPDDCCCS
jgi:hypothetical protein